jgi:vacuolar iron transporter family protein
LADLTVEVLVRSRHAPRKARADTQSLRRERREPPKSRLEPRGRADCRLIALIMAEREPQPAADPHRKPTFLSDILLGGQDGLVNVLGMVLGVATATRSGRIVLAAGLAAALSASISMAAVAYTSTVVKRDIFRSERAREYRHVAAIPDQERAEIRSIYAKKGFSGDLLERIVATITGDRDVWVAVMMSEEHGLADVDRRKSLRSAITVGLASLVGSLVPLCPFVVLPVMSATWVAVGVSLVALAAFGAYKAILTVGSPWKSGLQLAAIGAACAFVGYAIGAFLEVSGAT